MRPRRIVLATFVFGACITSVHSEESAQQPLSVAEFVNRGTVSRISTYAEVCIKHEPGAKATWDRTLENISASVDRLTRELMTTAPFADLAKAPIPRTTAAELLHQVDMSNGDLKAQVEGTDPDANCPQYLKNAQGFNDDSLRAVVTQALVGVQATLAATKNGHNK
jgi:hypothetical protein